MRRRYQKEKNDAALDGYRQWARDICEEAVEADRCNDGKTLYRLTKILAKSGKMSAPNVSPELDSMCYDDGGCVFDKRATTPVQGRCTAGAAQTLASWFMKSSW